MIARWAAWSNSENYGAVGGTVFYGRFATGTDEGVRP